MKTLKLFLSILAMALILPVQAQSVDEIVANYFENTGGVDAWKSLEGTKINASVNQQGMEIPLEIYQLKDGRQMTVVKFQGQEIKQGVFDGEVLWNTNFMTMKAEKSDAEATANFKLNVNDFPDSFMDYKEKGYTAELVGTEEFDGAEAFKIKLVKEPVTVDGNEEEDVSYYYFDTENFVPIGMQSEIRSGQAKGMTQEVKFSDYQEVDGLYFAFSIAQGLKDGQSNPITITSIELNPEVDDAAFAYPEEVATEENKE
ncbi:MAG: outer membrane lipoprotein-sorting protein [Eudoraea sp.]|nr:outer membrane lipoprotein-sorting protein [Eudoraea sp.]